jgi:hypothetical protein
VLEKHFHNLILPFLISFLIISFIITDITALNGGLGIDGMWYTKTVMQEDYAPSDYHIFKSFPSYLIKFILEIFNINKNNLNILLSFKFLNITSLCISILLLNKISKLFLVDKSFFIIISTLSFTAIKVSMYDVVTPDYFGFLLSTAFLYLYLNKKYFYLILVLFISCFTNAIVFLIGIVLLISSNTPPQNLNQKTVSRISFFLSFLFGMLILFWATYMIVPMHRAGMELTKWHIPDILDIELFPVSALIASFMCAYLSYSLFHHSIYFINLKNLLKVNLFWVVIFIALMILKSIVVEFNNSPTELDDIGHLLFMWPLYFCMKPLIGVSEHIHSLGILIIFALLLWKDLVSECSKSFGLGGLIILGLFVLFIIKPEARHTLPFVPFLSLLVARVIPDNFLNRKNILIVFITSLILSKFYYPLKQAEFSCDPQDFPAQHYLMFFGFSCNYTMYIFQILISIFILFLFGKLISNYKLS